MSASPESAALPDPDQLREAITSGDPMRALPSLARLREFPENANGSVVVPLLILGTEQTAFVVRSLSCSGLGMRRNEEGWAVLSRLVVDDPDANVRAEAANALASFGIERSWPLLHQRFEVDHAWLVRCSILSALAEQPGGINRRLLQIAEIAIADADGTVRVGGAEILGRLVQERMAAEPADAARVLLQGLQGDSDHRVVAAALNGLQSVHP